MGKALLLLLLVVPALASPTVSDVQDKDVIGPVVIQRKNNSPPPPPSDQGETQNHLAHALAQTLDTALKKEFNTSKEEAETGKEFQQLLAASTNTTHEDGHEETKVETVLRISTKGSTTTTDANNAASGAAAGATAAAGGSSGSSKSSTAATSSASSAASASDSGGGEAKADDTASAIEGGVDRIITPDDSEFILSKPSDSIASLTLDPQLIQDVTVILSAAAAFGTVAESLKQPVINGYLIGGALVGPGGLQLIKELVQVESLAQLGVSMLLFSLGMELSFNKLYAIWGVTIVGGSLQIVLSMALGGVVASVLDAPAMQGVFVGALLSMSSTTVVVKCLEAVRATGTTFGQITVGTLVLQDCFVGLLFALMPLFKPAPTGAAGGAAANAEDVAEKNATAVLMVIKVILKLGLAILAALLMARLLLARALRLLRRQASRELQQLALVSFCFGIAWLGGRLGLSAELGAFLAGVMVSIANTAAAAAAASSSSGGAPPDVAAGPGASGGAAAAALDHEAGSPVTMLLNAASSGPGTPVAGAGVGAGCGSPTHAAGGGASLRRRPSIIQDELHALRHSIDSWHNLLVALFMSSIGLLMSPRFLLQHLLPLTIGTACVTVVKSALVAAVVRSYSHTWRTAWAVGITMAHVGEFAFVLLSLGQRLGILPAQVYMLLLGVTALSLLTTPLVISACSMVLLRERERQHGEAGQPAQHLAYPHNPNHHLHIKTHMHHLPLTLREVDKAMDRRLEDQPSVELRYKH